MKNALLVTGATGSIGENLVEILNREDIVPIITYNNNKIKAEQLSAKYSSPSIFLNLQNTESINNLVNEISGLNFNLVGVLCASPNFELKSFM